MPCIALRNYHVESRTSIQSMLNPALSKTTHPPCRNPAYRAVNLADLTLIPTTSFRKQRHLHFPHTRPLDYDVGLGFICRYIVSFGRGVHTDIPPYLSLATSHCDVDESSSICYSLLGSALGALLLLLRLNLFTGSVSSLCCFDGEVAQREIVAVMHLA